MDEITIGAWNIRGLNTTLKLEDVDSYTKRNKVDIMGILETRIRVNNIGVLSSLEKHWCIDSNVGLAKNIRVVVMWKEATMTVEVLCKDAHFVHCHVRQRGGHFSGACYFPLC